jgi:hypothetical protein
MLRDERQRIRQDLAVVATAPNDTLRRSVRVRADLRAGCRQATLGRAAPTGSAQPSIWITDTVAEVPERLLPRARPTGTWWAGQAAHRPAIGDGPRPQWGGPCEDPVLG